MNWGNTKDFGACIKPMFAAVETDVTAGGSGDDTEVNGAWIDTRGFESLEAIISFTATLAANETLSLAAQVQHASLANGSDGEDVSTDHIKALASTAVATGEAGGSTETGVHALGIDLTMLKRYVRVQFTPDLSAADTDTAKVGMAYVLGGARNAPAHTARSNLRA
jgi:hypothetical protein